MSDTRKLGQVFKAHWPEGLEHRKLYEFRCDDKGRGGNCWLRLIVAEDGDVHLSMMDWEDPQHPDSKPSTLPTVRCRTLVGGGRHRRTRQALLWLAKAIELDNKELGIDTER